MTIIAIVPAHNEQDTIEQTLCDLVTQSCVPDEIVVVADNCTDQTVEIARGFEAKWPVSVLVTVGNTDRKAGAVNQALASLPEDTEYVLLMDADTSLGEQAIETAIEYMETHPSTAAVCSRAGVSSLKPGSTPWQWLLHRLQRVEYATSDSQRAETPGAIRCIHGMAALHRFSMLSQAGFYNQHSMVEDYDLTICYKEMGYKTATEVKMAAWTTVPTSLKALWKQRLRWTRGSVDTLQEHGWNKATRKEILGHFLVTTLSLTRLVVTLFFVWDLVTHSRMLVVHPAYLAVLLALFADILYRMRYVESACPADYLIRLLLVPEMLYNCFRQATVYWSYMLAFGNIHQEW